MRGNEVIKQSVEVALNHCDYIFGIEIHQTTNTEVLERLRVALGNVIDTLSNINLEIESEKEFKEDERVLTRLLSHEQMNLTNILKLSQGITKSLEKPEGARQVLDILSLKPHILFAKEFLDIYSKCQEEQSYTFIDLLDKLKALEEVFALTNFNIVVTTDVALSGRRNLIINLALITNVTKFRLATQELLRNALKYGHEAPHIHLSITYGRVYICYTNKLKEEYDIPVFSSKKGANLIVEVLGQSRIKTETRDTHFHVSLGPFDLIDSSVLES
jgi:signal transduction histidine kinase